MTLNRGRPTLPPGLSKDADHKVFITSLEKRIVKMMPMIMGQSGSEFMHSSFVQSLRQTMEENPNIKKAYV